MEVGVEVAFGSIAATVVLFLEGLESSLYKRQVDSPRRAAGKEEEIGDFLERAPKVGSQGSAYGVYLGALGVETGRGIRATF